MTHCPVCETQLNTAICPECGFDCSRDYEAYPTFGPVGAAVSRRRDLLRCSGCGSIHFGLRRPEGTPVCLKCGRGWTPFSLSLVAPAAYHSVFLRPDGTAAAVGEDKYSRCQVSA